MLHRQSPLRKAPWLAPLLILASLLAPAIASASFSLSPQTATGRSDLLAASRVGPYDDSAAQSRPAKWLGYDGNAVGSTVVPKSGARPGFVRPGSPEPNLGRAPQHGSPVHNEQIDRVAMRMEELGWRDIRKNQRQVDANLDTVGANRPDLSGINPKTGQRVNIEFDTNPGASVRHQGTVVPNDPDAVSTFIVIDPKTGKPIAAKTYK